MVAPIAYAVRGVRSRDGFIRLTRLDAAIQALPTPLPSSAGHDVAAATRPWTDPAATGDDPNVSMVMNCRWSINCPQESLSVFPEPTDNFKTARQCSSVHTENAP